jgi:hypothetical protein
MSRQILAYLLGSSYLRLIVVTSIAVAPFIAATPSPADVIVDMDFDGATGVENAGIGPDGTLLNGASIGIGVGVGGTNALVTDGSNEPEPAGAGLDLPLSALNPFGGDSDFTVSFDFSTTDDLGVLFSSDGSHVTDPSEEGQEGSINIFNEDGIVVTDFWYIEGLDAPGSGFNDGSFHSVLLEYDSTAKTASLSVDGGEASVLDFNETEFGPFSRDASQDLTRLGDENNFDFGVEINDGCECTFDNLFIEGTAPAPVPFSVNVNRDTGNVTLENISGEATAFQAYELLSDGGTLDPATWDSIDGRDDADAGGDESVDPDNDWSVTSSSDTALSEEISTGTSLTVADAGTIGLGNIWKRSPIQDMDFNGLDGVGEEINGSINYTGTPILFGDLNLDTNIDVADYRLFSDGFDEDVTGLSLVDAYFLADLNGDELHNFEDFIAFAEAYDGFNGEGAFAAMLKSVPEPSTLVILIVGIFAVAATRARRCASVIARIVFVVFSISLLVSSRANAAPLVEYLFDTNFNDTSGNGRTGIPSLGSTPSVSGGRMQLTGDFEEGLIVPLGAANPFGGLSDYSLEMTFNSSGNSFFPDAGVILFGSSDETDPTSPDNQSMSIFVEPQVDGGSLVVDYFFVGEVRIPDAELLDGMDHTIKVTYVAPDDPGTMEEPNPGSMFLQLDGEWRTIGEIAPRQPNPANYDVRIGGTLNEDFPFECAGGECYTTELEGMVDDFRVYDEEMAPSVLRAEVDLTTGEITLLGGEFHRDIRYYELASESGSLNPDGWDSFESQMLNEISPDDGDHWNELAGDESMLAEGFLLGSSSFDENRTESLGTAFSTGGTKDLELIAVTSDLVDIPVEVSYVNPPVGVPGDYDASGQVAQGDLDLVLLNWGKTVPPDPVPEGWINEQPAGLIGQGALDGVLLNWGNTAASGAVAGAAVPEPAAFVTILIAAAALGARRRAVPNGL